METGKRQQYIHGTESEIQLNNEGKTGIAIVGHVVDIQNPYYLQKRICLMTIQLKQEYTKEWGGKLFGS